MFMGKTEILAKMMKHAKGIENTDDDQLFYTNLFLDEDLRVESYCSWCNLQ